MNYDIDDKYVNREIAIAQFLCWPFAAVWAFGIIAYWF